ncbi:CesT family type III secretion system chaperone [Photobacterium damselae subsp. piscicida]|uniref:Exoenzyme S synthesis protein C n=2 Tax=Photobacterium damselae TaxID=38293 RepID=A0A2T3Q2K9_PHODM|nr:CesT family type III secretion system chaperone [Photobacterium damselae]MDP2545859.1 CesT family type III secretion system chaperone [Photobacterium damselae subsp. piscicida]MDP2558415.1 CesT family type III secretion system chaperone [Photobacterium damselae subsp. piscicida]PSW77171.1 exoenzyme S synthesis protein C [Photobacterium damselae]QOD55123.1 CesT family type III secretion system chaperone [Photobacterium damselae subsp. piscicida]QOD58948.1 CesT family type III secretion syste
MSARQIVDEVLLKFAHQIGLPKLQLIEDELGLAFDDNLRVHVIFHPTTEMLQLEAEIVDLQIINSDLYRSFIAFNYHWSEHQLFFSLDNHRHKLCLNRLLHAESLDYELFEDALAELLTQSESWEDLLSAHIAMKALPSQFQSSDLIV